MFRSWHYLGFISILSHFMTTTKGDIGYFWHVTDFHWDPTYTRNVSALSCGPTARDRTDFGSFGDYKCDPPWQLITASVHAMKEIYQDPDFLIWTGDDTPHIWNDTILHREMVIKIVQKETNLLQEVFPDHTVFSAIGNHDWSPKNQIPPYADNGGIYNVFGDLWKGWFNNQSDPEETFRRGGYYTMKSEKSSVRVVVLNTNLYYTSNELVKDFPDPAHQLQWFHDVMLHARLNNYKVIVVAHIPPGMFEKHRNKNWFYPDYNRRFLRQIQLHAGSIGSIHAAHHHTDTFRVLYDDKGVAVSSILIAPAVTPWETTLPGVVGGAANNPSIRLLKYNRTSGEILDVLQYYMNLTDSNIKGKAEWKMEYNASSYALPDMSTASLHNLAQRLKTDDVAFRKYLLHNGVSYNPDEQCDQACKAIHYCAVTQLHYDNYENCFREMTKIPTDASPVRRANILSLYLCPLSAFLLMWTFNCFL